MISFWNPKSPARSDAIWRGHVFCQNLSAPAFDACHRMPDYCQLLPAVKCCDAAVRMSTFARFGDLWLQLAQSQHPFARALAA